MSLHGLHLFMLECETGTSRCLVTLAEGFKRADFHLKVVKQREPHSEEYFDEDTYRDEKSNSSKHEDMRVVVICCL